MGYSFKGKLLGEGQVKPPSPKEQVAFLTNLQRLLSEGSFTATYKYALLLALADIAVESGDDSGDVMEIETRAIAEKFVQYYWRQAVPFLPKFERRNGEVLLQNTNQKKQAAVISRIIDEQNAFGDSLTALRRSRSRWNRLISKVNGVVKKMPLWKLQVLGGEVSDFLYPNVGRGDRVQLRPGIGYCLRHFHGIFVDLVQGAWTRYVRRNNSEVLGSKTDLSEFLFGSERADLSDLRPVLEDIQSKRCFYCEKEIASVGHVDHFVPWSRYPVDLGHNFVVAHRSCNLAKADHLAAAEFLDKWVQRNRDRSDVLCEAFDLSGIIHDRTVSSRVAQWAYGLVEGAGGLTWVRGNDLTRLPRGWRSCFRQEAQACF